MQLTRGRLISPIQLTLALMRSGVYIRHKRYYITITVPIKNVVSVDVSSGMTRRFF